MKNYSKKQTNKTEKKKNAGQSLRQDHESQPTESVKEIQLY